MRVSLRHLLVLVAVAAVFSCAAAMLWRSRAPDAWGYGKLGVSNGAADSPDYYLEVRGIGATPTIVRIVRFADQASTPANAVEIARGVSAELDSHTQNAARWPAECILIAGRNNQEKIVIPIDSSTAKRLFSRGGTRFDNFDRFEELWNDHIASHMPNKE